MPEPHHSSHDTYLKNYLKTGKAKIIGIGREVVGRRRDGSTFPVDLAVTETRLDDGRYFIGRITDITGRKATETRLKLALEVGGVGLSTYDFEAETLINDVNIPSFNVIDVGEHSGTADNIIERLFDPRDINRYKKELEKAFESGRLDTEVRIKFSEEESRIISIKSIIEHDPEGKPIKQIMASHLYQSEEKRSAYFDIATGVPNINLLIYEGREALIQDEDLICIYIGINNKKTLMAQLGDSKTHAFLKAVAHRIDAIMGNSLITAMTIDKNFALLFKGKGRRGCEEKVRKVLDSFKKPFELEVEQKYVEISIGVALSDQESDIEALLENSLIAQKEAKRSLSGSAFYSPEMGEMEKRVVSLKNSLHAALSEHQFYLVYQPLVTMDTGKIIGVEALCRWEHPEYGFVGPDEFIPLIENDLIVHDFGKWVLNTACRQNKAWQDEGIAPIYVAVNVTAKQLLNPDFPSFVKDTLKISELAAKYLKLEVTETGLINNPDKAKEVIIELQKSRVTFLMDDFGTGYASLGYLEKFPFDGFKIDKSFIDGIPEDKGDYAIVNAAIGIGKALGLTIIAEGIEKHETYSFLNVMGCQVAQGYLISKPLRSGDVAGFLRGYKLEKK